MKDSESAKQILEIVPRTMRVIRAELRGIAKSELTVPQFRILIHLSRAPHNNCQLAEIQGVSVAAMSRMVDGLHRRGLIKRTEKPGDRRQTMLDLTDVGRQTVKRITSAVEKKLTERIAKLDEAPRKALVSGLSVLKEVFSS